MTAYVLWAKHERVRRWLPIPPVLSGRRATEELVRRQDRVRRSKEPCVFRVLPVGEYPDER